jgi:hypothetical protein
MNMRTRKSLFLLMLCLGNTLAFADNPSDAPLLADDTQPAAVRPEGHAGCADQHRKNRKVSQSKGDAKVSSAQVTKAVRRADGAVRATAMPAL